MKANISSGVINLFEKKHVLSLDEISCFYHEINPNVTDNATRWVVKRLRDDHKIYRVSKGLYCLGARNVYKPQLDHKIKTINGFVLKSFPLIDFLIWDTAWLNTVSHHQSSFSNILIEVEKGFEDVIYEKLSDRYNKVYLNPSKKEYEVYINSEDAIVVKTMMARSPKQKVGKVCVPKLEKLVVDTFVEKYAFNWIQGSEWERMLINIMEMFEVNLTTLLNYARYRNKAEDIEEKIRLISINDECYRRALSDNVK